MNHRFSARPSPIPRRAGLGVLTVVLMALAAPAFAAWL